jgi:protocatechuate 3,4-dioxygenase beta subunit
MNPRRVLAGLGLLVLLGSFASGGADNSTAGSPSAQAPGGSKARFTPAPGTESEEIRQLIDRADAELRSGKGTTDILTNPSYVRAHEWPRFRKLIRAAGKSSKATIVTQQEPGTALVVSGRVVDAQSRAVGGALVYVYQTSAEGCYSDRAAHFAAHEGDRRHARLFGYLTTDAAGRFELRTIRPGGYPDGNLPAHIHVEVEPVDRRLNTLVTEIVFDDDPRLTPEARKRSLQEGFVIAAVTKVADSAQRVEVQLRLR